jgi:hypothetical protein
MEEDSLQCRMLFEEIDEFGELPLDLRKVALLFDGHVEECTGITDGRSFVRHDLLALLRARATALAFAFGRPPCEGSIVRIRPPAPACAEFHKRPRVSLKAGYPSSFCRIFRVETFSTSTRSWS